jgi:hypothetical protein
MTTNPKTTSKPNLKRKLKTIKSIRLFQECENEIYICEKIRKIPYFFLFYNPVINHKLLKASDIDEYALENSDSFVNINEKNNNYVLIFKTDLPYPNFNFFFKTINSTREKIIHLFDTYTYLLKAINELNSHNVVCFNIDSDKIGFNIKKQPILNNFSDSFFFPIDNLSRLNKRFAKYTPNMYSLPLEFHIIAFLKDSGREKKSISQSNIEDICKEFIVKNYALLGFSHEVIKDFYKKCVTQCLLFEIINQPSEKIIKEMLDHSITWDNYSLSCLFLPIITSIQNKITGENDFLCRFSQLLLLNMDQNPKNRLSPLESIKRFQTLFTNSIDWNSIANVSIDF